AASFRKGERVIVSGRLRVRKWENDEKSGTSVEVEADALGHDLRWGVSRFEKRTGPAESGSATAEGGSEPGDTGTADDGVTVDGATSNGEPSRDGFMPLAA
ncbi:MAG: single-stranded DNA-binding protein, partial [Leucobacter sp.]